MTITPEREREIEARCAAATEEAGEEAIDLLRELSRTARLPSGASYRSSKVTYPAATFHKVNALLARLSPESAGEGGAVK